MSVPKRVRFLVLIRDNFTCRYCGRRAPAVELHVDHVHPASRGGSDKPENLVAACIDCNQSKQDKLLPLDIAPTAHREHAAAPTVPLPSRCSWCSRMCAAIDERAWRTDGFVAFYACLCGGQWRVYSARHLRVTQSDASALITDWNAALRPEAKDIRG